MVEIVGFYFVFIFLQMEKSHFANTQEVNAIQHRYNIVKYFDINAVKNRWVLSDGSKALLYFSIYFCRAYLEKCRRIRGYT